MKKKKSTRATGVEFQRYCKGLALEHYEGSVVHNQPLNHVCIGPGKWICVSNDIFGCVDLIVIQPFGKPVFIQVSVDRAVEKRLSAFSVVPWDLNHVDVELWIKRKAGVVDVKRLYRLADESAVLVDTGRFTRRIYEPV